jgi:pyruvate dehydrogenase E2 component (dihydrolipoamide acetyltransferase)
MDEGTFLGWIKKDGDQIAVDDPLFTLEGEKATEEIASLASGTLHILPSGPKPGDMVPVGRVIGQLLSKGEAAPAASTAPTLLPLEEATVESTKPPPAAQPPRRARVRTPAASPRARRIAAELNLDWSHLQGSGSTGRIRERDIRAAAAARAAVASNSIRRKIAQRLRESLRATVPVTLVTTADATHLVLLYQQFHAVGKQTRSGHPSYVDFLVKLVAGALLQHPQLNAHTDGKEIKLCEAIHIGIAVDTEAGLVVPVVRDVAALSLKELGDCSKDLITRARKGLLKASEMRDGTFTVSSLSNFGIDAFTPVLNPPQCAILGVGRIQRRPAVREEKIVPRDEITLSLTFDHCAMDGAPAARFLQSLRERIENPGPWLIS